MDDAFAQDLERRLAVIEDPDYVDPAREDLPARDLGLLTIIGAVVVVLLVLWTYPA